MLRADASPVQDRIKQLKSVAFPSTVQFSACNVTRQGMEKKEGHAIEILSEASVVPSGVVHLMELQEKGWSYIRSAAVIQLVLHRPSDEVLAGAGVHLQAAAIFCRTADRPASWKSASRRTLSLSATATFSAAPSGIDRKSSTASSL
jgi:hypothetical protein